MDDWLIYLNNLDRQYQAWLTLAGLLFFVFGMMMFALPALSQKWKEWRMVRCIRKTSQACLQDVFLSDGVDGVLFYPFIILTRQGIVFFKTMQFRGIIFAADAIDYWTQVVGKRSYKFHNPLPALEVEMASIKALDKKIPVEGRVIFTSDSHFPKGRPTTVMLETEIKEYLQQKMQGEMPVQLADFWETLKAASEQGQQDKLLMSRPKALSRFRQRMVWFAFAVSILWLVIRLT